MSSNLTWEPAERNTKALGDDLKRALQKKYAGMVDQIMDQSDIGYLEGLRDAGMSEAQLLLDAIEKHDRVHVREEF